MTPTSISASRSSAVFCGRSVLRVPSLLPRPRGAPRLLSQEQLGLLSHPAETCKATATDLAGWVPSVTAATFSAGVTRDARLGVEARREGSTTTSIFMGRSGGDRWRMIAKGQGMTGKGGVNWSVEHLAVRKANERRKRAEQRNSCGARQSSDPSIEHRTSLIFSLNLAQRIERGIVKAVLAVLRSQTSSTGPVLKRQRTCTRSTALQNWNLSQSDTPILLTTLDP